MIEGLAVWGLFIYLLRMVGMPWNKFTQSFAFLGGGAWLLFVWVGLLNFTPMDISGGSVVQSPHIQLRPGSANVSGKVKAIHISPNQQVSKGQLIYELDDEPYQIAADKAKVQVESARVALDVAKQDVLLAEQKHLSAGESVSIAESDLSAALSDLKLKQTTLKRYQEQNRVVAHTVTESQLDEQQTAVTLAKQKTVTLENQIEKLKVDQDSARLGIEKARLMVKTRRNALDSAEQDLEKANWDLSQTKVYAPADGYVTNFMLREGQLVGRLPRIQMYTEEKYVLMRVNHQAIRNVQVGNMAEFASPVYPGKVFSAEVEGIIEATGEAQGNLLGFEQSVRGTTGQNLANKHHFVRLKLHEPEGYDIPVGSVGLGWVSGEKPVGFLAFLDVIRGIIIRMKSQIYFFYSL